MSDKEQSDTQTDKKVISEKLKKRLSVEEYERAKILWQRKGSTLAEIAEELDVSVHGLHRRFKRDGITKNEHAHLEQQAVQRRIQQTAGDSAQEMITRSEMVKELALKGVEQGVKLSIKIATDLIREKKPIENMERDQKAINAYMSNMKTAMALCTDIVNQYEELDESNLPVLEIRQMTDDDVARIQAEMEETDELMGELDVFSEDGGDDDSEEADIVEIEGD